MPSTWTDSALTLVTLVVGASTFTLQATPPLAPTRARAILLRWLLRMRSRATTPMHAMTAAAETQPMATLASVVREEDEGEGSGVPNFP